MFVGVYLGDEPGGKMLDGSTTFNLQGITVNKSNDGIVSYDDGKWAFDIIFSKRQN
jgi:hypothetical protein